MSLLAPILALLLGLQGEGPASEAHARGRHEEALALYTQMLENRGNGDEGRALHGMGDCLYRLGRPAEALLAYRRAALRRPRDPAIAFNLKFVSEALGVTDPAADSPVAALRSASRVFTIGELFAVGLVLQSLGVILFRTGKSRGPRRRLAGFLLVIGLPFSLEAAWRQWGKPIELAVVLDARADLMEGSSPSAGKLGALRPGETLTVLRKEEGWLEVEGPQGRGFVPRSAVGLVD